MPDNKKYEAPFPAKKCNRALSACKIIYHSEDKNFMEASLGQKVVGYGWERRVG